MEYVENVIYEYCSKGALTASVMNAGTKMVRGVAFGAANQYTQSEIIKRKQALPNDIRTVLSLKDALYHGVCNVGGCVYQILSSECGIPMVNIDVDKTVSRVKFAVEGFNANRLSKEEATDKICQSISENPYWLLFYKELYVMNKSEKEAILQLADYLGMYYKIYRIMCNIDEGKKNWDEPEISYKR